MKKIKIRLIILLSCVFTGYLSNAQNAIPQLGKAPVKDIIKEMTLAEKVSLVTGTGMRFAGTGPVIGEADGRVPGSAGNTMNLTRFGIPGTVLSDGPAGVRIDPIREKDKTKTYYATAWPIGTLLASSWDTALVKKLGAAFGNEIKEYGIDVILGPGMNIQRNPLNGRNFEYFSEDPFVSGWMGASMVNGIQSIGVGTSIKHFAANNQETNRSLINVAISERALREIYLKGFEITVKESQPLTVMSSYNKINGTYTSESNDLLTKILRNEWGFKGIVMTDWFGGRDPIAQMKAGNDLIEPGTPKQRQAIMDAVNGKILEEKILDENVERILNYVMKTPSFKKYPYSNHPDLKMHAQLSRNAAAQGMVLLENKASALPIKPAAKLALFGIGSYKTIIGGTGSGEVHIAHDVSFQEGLSNAGYKVDTSIYSTYAKHISNDINTHPAPKITLGTPRMIPELSFDQNVLEKAAQNNDIAILTISRNAGEGADRKVENDFNLSNEEIGMIKSISNTFHNQHKKLIIVLNIGGVIEMASWKDYADAILLAWQPGLEAGNAITDVISGIVNPSGKLAISFPAKYSDIPSAEYFPGTPRANPNNVIYQEGIYVGYRYFNTFKIKPTYSFGYGLSYTKFEYSNLKLSSKEYNKPITVQVNIRNTGKLAGKEVVQLYLTAPNGNVDKPSVELKGFAKTKELKPGEMQVVTFTIKASDMASFNTDQLAWIADPGNYQVKIGASSENIQLSGSFNLPNKIIVEKVQEALSPNIKIEELKINR